MRSVMTSEESMWLCNSIPLVKAKTVNPVEKRVLHIPDRNGGRKLAQWLILTQAEVQASAMAQ